MDITGILLAVAAVGGVKVNTINYDGKAKRLGAGRPGKRKSWKKAYVQLTKDSKTCVLYTSVEFLRPEQKLCAQQAASLLAEKSKIFRQVS